MTPTHKEAIAMVAKVIRDREGGAVVYGKFGTGKTTLMRRLYSELRDFPDQYQVGVIENAGHCPTEFQLAGEIIESFGGKTAHNDRKGRYDQVKQRLFENFHQKITSILLIDEAQELPAKVLESLRGYLNFETGDEKILQIVLFALPSITRKLAYAKTLRNRLWRTELKEMTRAELAEMLRWRFTQAGGMWTYTGPGTNYANSGPCAGLTGLAAINCIVNWTTNGCCPTSTPTPTPTSTPTPVPTPTPTSPISYPIGVGQPTPVINDPSAYGTCTNGEDGRPACAVQTYLTAVADNEFMAYGANGSSMPWELFIALTIAGEGGIFYINPDLEANRKTYDMKFVPDIDTFRGAFESAIYNQLISACNGTSCTEANFIKYLAGPPFNEWGIQAWYQAANPGSNQANLSTLKGTGTVLYTNFIDNGEKRLNGDLDTRVVRWGNPSMLSELNNAVASASYLSASATYGKVDPTDPNRVFFLIK